MSAMNPSGDLSPFSEVVPESASFHGVSRSSLLTQRKRVRITPQTGQSVGAAGAGAGGQQVQFLLADQGGMIDPRSVVLNYHILTSNNGAPDDGHPYGVVQVSLNGQLLDSITNAAKVTAIEAKMGGSKGWYQTAGSFAGFELLSDDLNAVVPNTTVTTPMLTKYGAVGFNLADVYAKASRAASAYTGGIAGEQRSIPMGLISGVFRAKQYLPLSLLGELNITLVCLSAAEALVTIPGQTSTNGDYSLSNISLEYDVVQGDPRYMEFLQKAAQEAGPGITIPFESTICASAGTIATSTSLKESSIVVSRATNHLLRSSVVQVPSAGTASYGLNSQSCFSHAGLWGVQWRIGSQMYPQIPAQGDASIFNMSMAAYGSPIQESGSVINRMLWCNSTNPGTVGTAAVYAADCLSNSTKFAYGDSCCPTYGFRTVKGAAIPLDVDGVSVSGSSGAQVIVSLTSAPPADYTPFVTLVALKFIQARGGAVTVAGA